MKEKGFTPNRHAADSEGIEQYLSYCMRSCSIDKPISRMTGFTLIELSIVLVIIGLIVGGVLVGQDLIRAAELRSITSDLQKYETTFNAFRLKYNCLPGDCNNAYDFFGADCGANTVGAANSCNGDGNKMVWDSYEDYKYWVHLSLAGLLEGSYTGGIIASTNNTYQAGGNAPALAMTGGMTVVENGSYSGFIANYLVCKGYSTANGWRHSLLKPVDAKSIDDKLDDGNAATGSVIAVRGNDAGGGTCITTDYVLTDTTVSCVLRVKLH